VPEFERAYEELKVGEVGQPVRNAVRLSHHPGARTARERRLARAPAHPGAPGAARPQADEAYTEWLRQLRDSTYVELRLDER